ncbi:MAG: hypothetical protein PHN85_11300 [Kiritimatiellae bacterium]|nr:hypothetical protein [Kiritimatiellia bacterium]
MSILFGYVATVNLERARRSTTPLMVLQAIADSLVVIVALVLCLLTCFLENPFQNWTRTFGRAVSPQTDA